MLTLTGRFLQYYRENANWLERTYAFVPRIGIERIRAVIVDDSDGIAAAAGRRDRRSRRRRTGIRGRSGAEPVTPGPVPPVAAADPAAPGAGPGGDAVTADLGAEYRLGPVAQIPLGEGRAFAVATAMVAVFRLRDGGLRAVSAVCPHAGGPIADGLADRGRW